MASEQKIDAEGNNNYFLQHIKKTSFFGEYQQARIKGDYNVIIQIIGNAPPKLIKTCLELSKAKVELAKDMGMTEKALDNFYKLLGREKTPIEEWPTKLAEIAKDYNELLANIKRLEGDDPELKALLEKIRATVEALELDKARTLLDKAVARAADTSSDTDAMFIRGKLSQAEIETIYGGVEVLDLKYKAAAERYEKALNILDGSIGIDLQTQAIKEQIIDYAIAAGRYFDEGGLYDKALLLKKISVERARHDLSPTHPTLAAALNNLANLYRTQGKYDEAEPLYLEDIKITKQSLGDNHPSLATSLNNLAGLYEDQGHYDKAEPLYEQAIDIKKQSLGDNHPSLATSLNNLAGLYQAQGKYDEAEPLYLEDIKITKQSLGDNHPSLATSLNNLAGLYKTQGKYDEAEPLYQQSMEINKQSLGDNHPDLAASLNNLAGLYKAQGKYEEAETLYLQDIEITKKTLGDNHPDLATSLNNLALLYEAQGHYNKAEPLYKQAVTIFKDKLPADHPNIKIVEDHLKILRGAMGKL